MNRYIDSKKDFTPSDIWQIDLSKPDLQEAMFSLNLYYACVFILQQTQQDEELKHTVNYMFGKEAFFIFENFKERFEIILPELTNIINGTATAEDYEELAWQNTLANTRTQLEQWSEKQNLAEAEEGGFCDF